MDYCLRQKTTVRKLFLCFYRLPSEGSPFIQVVENEPGENVVFHKATRSPSRNLKL